MRMKISQTQVSYAQIQRGNGKICVDSTLIFLNQMNNNHLVGNRTQTAIMLHAAQPAIEMVCW